MNAIHALRDEIRRQTLRGGPTNPAWLRILKLANDAVLDQDTLVRGAGDFLIEPTENNKEALMRVVNKLSGADKAFAFMEKNDG